MPKERMHEIACRGFTAVIDEEKGTVALRFIDDTGAAVDVATLSAHTAVDRLLPHEDDPLCYDTLEDIDEAVLSAEFDEAQNTFRMRVRSTAWQEKEYRFRFAPDGVFAETEVHGQGRVGEIRYFGGKWQGDMLGASDFEFCEYFVPISDFFSAEHRIYNSIEDFHSYFDLLVPPLYVYAFRTLGVCERLSMGLIGRENDWNFMKFDYHKRPNRGRKGFYLSTDFEGHKEVTGSFITPAVRIETAPDNMAAARQYAAWFYESGTVQKRDYSDVPAWWWGPMACGWREQYALGGGSEPDVQATEENYRAFADKLCAAGLCPRILIVDDKWQAEYGSAEPDPAKWHDMRKFTDDMRARGIHTLLWFKLWAAQGLDDALKIPESDATPYGKTMSFNEGPYADPSNPAYRAALEKIIYRLLSDDPGCIGADGFKLDFAFMMPRGRRARSHSGAYGTQLLLELLRMIREIAKSVKPNALINCSPCHPIFAGIPDQCRLHDYDDAMRGYEEEMAFRRDLFEAAFPGVLIDTDSPCYGSKRSSMRAALFQSRIGIPDLYRISPDADFSYTAQDLAVLRTAWDEYRRLHP